MNRDLILIPGAGDPNSAEYFEEFQCITNKAVLNGYRSVKTMCFPGHRSFQEDITFHNVQDSIDILLPFLKTYEDAKIEYDIFARSYGCSILLQLLIKVDLIYLNRVTLWAPPPFLYIYKLTVQEQSWKERAKTKGAFFNDETFHSSTPISLLLIKYKGKQKLRLGFGGLDEHSDITFYHFLKKYLGNQENLDFSLLPNQKHNFDFNDKEVELFLFKDL